ncbi:hypothetical protein V1477_016371 [Vespula maculifrons]|uniref:Uncharacterized protein n=1 Tax=Vespula maculifrons TaxID=7453 RepID=A0ABD2BD26_VESMC
MTNLEGASHSVPPLHTSCDPSKYLDLRENFLPLSENMTYLEVARHSVPPLHTSCDPSKYLGLRENFLPRAVF